MSLKESNEITVKIKGNLKEFYKISKIAENCKTYNKNREKNVQLLRAFFTGRGKDEESYLSLLWL